MSYSETSSMQMAHSFLSDVSGSVYIANFYRLVAVPIKFGSSKLTDALNLLNSFSLLSF